MPITELYSFLANSAKAAVCLTNTSLHLNRVSLLFRCSFLNDNELKEFCRKRSWYSGSDACVAGRLFDWDAEEADVGASQGYSPPNSLDSSHFWQDLRAESQKAQLKAAILGVQSDPKLAIGHAVPVCHHSTGQPYLEELGFLDYNAGRACLQRSDSCIFFANDTYGDLAQALTTVTRMLTEKRTKRHVGHVLIMPCWNNHDRQFSREDVAHACQSVLNNKWTPHAIYSTAPLAQCIKPARLSSPASMSTDSDNESDVGNPGRVSQLLPHLVIGFSYNKHKKQKRFPSPDSEDLLVASRRKISISDTAAGSSQVTGSLPSPSFYPTSPSSKPLSPMGSLASVPEQVAFSRIYMYLPLLLAGWAL